jgi:hypothetical protein
MEKRWISLKGLPTFWRGTLVGVLLAVLALGAAQVVEQIGGDLAQEAPPRSEPGLQTETQPPLFGEESNNMFGLPTDDAFSTAAAVASIITYQGTLSDGTQPATGSFDFHFRLFNATTDGTQIGEQFANAVTVERGLFTVPLDFGAAVYSGQAVWLEIAVRPAGGAAYTTLTPRQSVTPAPLALGLPNVSTNPESGRVSIGGGQPISSFEMFGIHRPIENWVGMYITGGGPNARPFYGYATADQGGTFAWTEWNGPSNEWRLYTVAGNVLSVTQAGDVRANGSFSQPLNSSGLVKAAASAQCYHESAFLAVNRSFNTITNAPVTAAVGPMQGECYINFGFNLTGRYFTAMAVQPGAPRGVTCAVDSGNANRLHCMRWRITSTGAEGWGGAIMVAVY